MTQYHHISTSAAPYWPSTTQYQPAATYIVVARGLQTTAQFTLGLVILWVYFYLTLVQWYEAPPVQVDRGFQN